MVILSKGACFKLFSYCRGSRRLTLPASPASLFAGPSPSQLLYFIHCHFCCYWCLLWSSAQGDLLLSFQQEDMQPNTTFCKLYASSHFKDCTASEKRRNERITVCRKFEDHLRVSLKDSKIGRETAYLVNICTTWLGTSICLCMCFFLCPWRCTEGDKLLSAADH